MTATVYILGIVLQALATIIAFAQVRCAPRKLPWLLIALSSLLIVVRRTATLGQIMKAGGELALAEVITLIVTLLFLVGVILMTRMFRDVLKGHVALKESEAALQATSRYARSLIETSLDPLLTINAYGKITDVNTATETITGRSREMLIGSDFSEYFTEPEMARAGYQKVFAQGQVTDYPLAVRHSSGTVTEVLYNASVYRDEDGNVLGVFAAARDITARKRAEEEKEKLEAQNRQLQKSHSLGRMAGAIAHHFNNQLHAVMGNLDLALDRLSEHTDVTENLNDAIAATHKAAELSGLMLTYLGQTPCKREPLDLAEVCRQHLPVLTAAMPKNVVLEAKLPSPGPAIRANAGQIQQLLANLVTNAWEAADRSPCVLRVSVTTILPSELSESNRFPIDWQKRNHAYACLEVADTGSGVAETDIDKLFDPFYSSKFAGRGLGLPVVLGIVRAHEGAITVRSELGKGSVFCVYLPLTTEEIPQPLKKAPPASDVQESGMVLVIDDQEMVRKVAVTMLTRLGFTVLAAKDGVEAVEMLRQHRHELECVLCDLTMPRMDGWETVAALRQIVPDIPVILASGYDEVHAMNGQHLEYPQAFLGKPYQFEALKDTIRHVLGKREKQMVQDTTRNTGSELKHPEAHSHRQETPIMGVSAQEDSRSDAVPRQ